MSYNFDPEDTMYEALAEKLDVELSVLELIHPYVGEDTGSSKDAWHYGYYFEFPRFDSFNGDEQKELKDQIDIESFPFGETIYFSDAELSDTKADPLGWRADYEADEYYQKYKLPKETVLEELNSIMEKIKSFDDELIIKALLFSAFSITESYVRSLIWDKIPAFENSGLDENLKEMLKKHLSDKLSKTQGRQEIYKLFMKNKLKSIPHNDPIRNALAHDIGLAQVRDGSILVKKRNDERYRISIEVIINDLKEYIYDVS